MKEFETIMELCGAPYSASIKWDWDYDAPFIESVVIHRDIKYFYNEKGDYAPRTERRSLDITEMLNDEQIAALMDEIITGEEEKAAEDWADSPFDYA